MAKKAARTAKKAPTPKEREQQVADGDLQEESLEDQLRADARSDAEIDLDPPLPQRRQPPTGTGFRPSDLEQMVAEHGRQQRMSADEIAQIDRFRFVRDRGLPNPTKLFRVTGRRGTKDGRIDYGPVEIEATDEADAILRAADQLAITYRDRHHVNFTVVVLEE